MNAALQALCNTTPLSQYFLQCLVLASNHEKPALSNNFQRLVQEMWQRNSPGFIVPSGILYGIRNVSGNVISFILNILNINSNNRDPNIKFKFYIGIVKNYNNEILS